MDYSYIRLRQLLWLLTRLVVLPHVGPLQVIVFFLATISYRVGLSVSLRFPDPVLRLSIGVLPMLLRRLAGYVTYYVSFIHHFLRLRLFIVIM